MKMHFRTAMALYLAFFASMWFGQMVWAAENICVPLPKVVDNPPDWWKNPGHSGSNPYLNDEDEDGVPDGWTVDGNATYDFGGHAVTLRPYLPGDPPVPIGSLSQTVQNDLQDKPMYKKVAVRLQYTALYTTPNPPPQPPPLGPGPPITVKVTGGVEPAKTQIAVRKKEGQWDQRYLILSLKDQPASETVTITYSGGASVSDYMKIDIAEIRTKCFKGEPNPKRGKNTPAPQARHGQSMQVIYDPQAKMLSFSGSTIDVLNLDGSDQMDPAFAADPILGAVMSMTPVTFLKAEGGGYYFGGGSFSITKDGFTYLTADVPYLLVDDQASAPFGDNIYGEFFDLKVDNTLGSAWLQAYSDFFQTTPFWSEMRANTELPLESVIADSLLPGVYDLFATTATEDVAFCVPEPSAVALFGTGILLYWTLRVCRRRTV